MFFLIRTAFWLTLVLVLIPLGTGYKSEPAETVDPVSAFLAAQATVSDIGGFCGRNPKACETGGDALTAIGNRARDGVRIVYEYLDTRLADQAAPETLYTGSTTVVPTSDTLETQGEQQMPQPTQETLSGQDVNPEPVPQPKPLTNHNA